MKGLVILTNKVTVYTSDDCIECEFLKKTLDEKVIAFEIKNISQNSQYQSEVEKYGFLGVPVTVVSNKAFKGLNQELIDFLDRIQK